MLITIRERAALSDVPKDLLTQIKLLLTIPNAQFAHKKSMGLSVWGIDPQLRYFEPPSGSDPVQLYIPTGSLNEVLKLAESWAKQLDFPLALDLVDKRALPSCSYLYKPSYVLRDYQEDLLDSLKGKTVGVVQADTGAGKTVCFVALAEKLKTTCLVLVHTKELAEQTRKAFAKLLGLELGQIGLLGSGKWELKPISVGLHQTLTRMDSERQAEIKDYFGLVIADETHLVAASTFYRNMNKLNSKYKFGFSATPIREDGLTRVIHWACGPLVHSVPKDKLADVLIRPTHEQIHTNFEYFLFDTSEYGIMLGFLAENKARNKLILDTFNEKKLSEKNCVLLCGRTDHIDLLQTLIPDSVALHSKLSKKEREARMAQIISGEKRHVISSWGFFSTGIDIPRLDTLLVCSPIKSLTKVKQAAGRIMRGFPGKISSHIVDFVDSKVWILQEHGKRRQKILKTVCKDG
jgi:superfamily II DNA or RNA helicase